MLVVPQISVTSDRVLFGQGDALEIARTFEAQGARALQIKDVDGSIVSAPSTPTWLELLLESSGIPVQYDGSLGDSQGVERIARLKFATIVVSQHAVFEPMFLRWAHDLLGKRLVVEVQADGDYLFDPPKSGFAVELVEAVRRLKFQGVRHILLRDVTGLELPLNRLRHLCRDVGMGITFAGLVRNLDDLRELTVVDSDHLHAVIVSEPLYDGRIRIADANAL